MSPDNPFFVVYPAWWALAMVFGTIPAFACIAVALDCGFEDRRFTVREVVERIQFMRKAKGESVRQTAKLFTAKNPALLAGLLALVLASIATDLVMLAVVNSSAILPSVIAHRMGRKHRRSLNISDEMSRAERMELFNSDPTISRTVAAVIVPWVITAGLLLLIAYAFGLWHPPYSQG